MKNLKKLLLTFLFMITTLGYLQATEQSSVKAQVIIVNPLPSPLCYVFCTYEVVFAGIGLATYQCFAGVCSIIDFVPLSGLNQEELSE